MSQSIGFFDTRLPGESVRQPDLVVESGTLKADNGLQTAVLISLFTDKRADFEELEGGNTELRGWWADLLSTPITDEIGSKLWLADRSKMDTRLLPLLEDYAKDALQWLIEDGIADGVDATATQIDETSAAISVNIYRPNGDNIPFKFLWDGQELSGSVN